MNGRKAAIAFAVAVATLFGSVPLAATGGEETVMVPIEVPAGTMPVGMYFADNMVFTPQWRVGNLVRIEMMVVDLTSTSDVPLAPAEIPLGDVDMYDQAELLANPALIQNTRMVSVESIHVTVTLAGAATPVWDRTISWDPSTGLPILTADDFGREINKAGHLIYGGQWNTAGATLGTYVVEVELGPSFSIKYAMGSNKTNEAFPFEQLADEVTDPVYDLLDLGIGGVDADGVAWLELGVLVKKGGGRK